MIDYGKWRSMLGYGAFARKREDPLFVQFSGGRTSGFMACMAPDDAVITYENTGREHEKTLEFIARLGDALKRDIVWLEFRPPPRLGVAPKYFQWERVDFSTADRKGAPIAEFMEAINAYRRECGNPPIAPWVRGRLCTAYVKHKVLDHYIRDLGIRAHDRWIGIRADEPQRVAGLRGQETRDKGLLVPLYEGGVSKCDVVQFWDRQSFRLDLPEHLGNCDGCFLKDQADQSRAIGANPEAIAYWQGLQDTYPSFGGVNHPGYAQLACEYPVRTEIESALRDGRRIVNASDMDPKRFKLILIQERKRIENGPTAFSCACELSMALPEDEETDE